jgi:chromosome segregation ATPase
VNNTINIDDAIQTINNQNKRIEELVNINEKISLSLESAEKKLDQYKNNWEELKKWLNKEYDHYDKYGSAPTGCAMGEIKRTLNKMKELEEDK